METAPRRGSGNCIPGAVHVDGCQDQTTEKMDGGGKENGVFAMILRLVNDLGTSPGERLKGDVPKSIQPYMREKLVRMKCPLNLPEEPLLSFAFSAADAVAAFRHLRVPPPESGSVGQTRTSGLRQPRKPSETWSIAVRVNSGDFYGSGTEYEIKSKLFVNSASDAPWNGQRSDRNGNPTTGDAGGEVSLRAAVLWNRLTFFQSYHMPEIEIALCLSIDVVFVTDLLPCIIP
nr:(-)-alpha-terpineol synthase-like [Ipomoea batatas]